MPPPTPRSSICLPLPRSALRGLGGFAQGVQGVILPGASMLLQGSPNEIRLSPKRGDTKGENSGAVSD